VTVGAILLSFAAIIPASRDNFGFVLMLFGVGISVGVIWGMIVRDRGYNDSYLRWQILRIEDGKPVSENVLTEFRAWQQKRIPQKRNALFSDDYGRQLLSSPTRTVLDTCLPLIFFLFWMILLGYWIYLLQAGRV
jgi:hypothetical protein